MNEEIENILKEMRENREYIALQLRPAIGETTIKKEGNRMYINEGRKGKFENVTESFYDDMVQKYDSRINRD